MSDPKERDTCEVNEVMKRPFVQQFLFYWIVIVKGFFHEKLSAHYTDSNFNRPFALLCHVTLSIIRNGNSTR